MVCSVGERMTGSGRASCMHEIVHDVLDESQGEFRITTLHGVENLRKARWSLTSKCVCQDGIQPCAPGVSRRTVKPFRATDSVRGSL